MKITTVKCSENDGSFEGELTAKCSELMAMLMARYGASVSINVSAYRIEVSRPILTGGDPDVARLICDRIKALEDVRLDTLDDQIMGMEAPHV